MRCGEKRFLIEVEVDGEKQRESITARTSAEARRNIRMKCGPHTQIHSVREERRNEG